MSSDVPKMVTDPDLSGFEGYFSEGIQIRPQAVTELIKSYDHKFDFDLTKRMYFQMLRKIQKLDNGTLFPKYWNKLLLSEHIKSVKACVDKNTLEIYEVIEEDGADILIYKREIPEYPIIRLISAEDCFPIILNAHRDTVHGNEKSIKNKIIKKYHYPSFCIPLVLNSCNVCKEVSESYNTTECTSMQTDKATWRFITHKIKRGRHLNHILIYTELYTGFTLIRPVRKLTYDEVGTELYKIFRVFGMPQKILAPWNQMEFLVGTLKFFSAFDFDFIRVIGCNYNLFDISCVIDALNKWSNETGSNNWAIGAAIVQWKFNTSRRLLTYSSSGPILSGVPYNLFYGIDPAQNSPTSDIVAEQLGIKFRNIVRIELLSSNLEVINKIVNLGSDESNTRDTSKRDENNPKCCVCNEEFVIYTCSTCEKFVHYECGVVIGTEADMCVYNEFVCLICKWKK